MALRQISGLVRYASGQPAINQTVYIQLRPGSFDSEAQYLGSGETYTTDANGLLTVTLWANESGESPSLYHVNIGAYGDSFEFTLEPGTGDTTWSAVRLRGVVGEIDDSSALRAFVEQEIEEQLGAGGVFPTDSQGVVIIDAGLL